LKSGDYANNPVTGEMAILQQLRVVSGLPMSQNTG
jgi:hypothetical protein